MAKKRAREADGQQEQNDPTVDKMDEDDSDDDDDDVRQSPRTMPA
jgi:hypothetical protein